MKKTRFLFPAVLSLVLAIALLTLIGVMVVSTEEAQNVSAAAETVSENTINDLIGDLDGDGMVTPKDVTLLRRYIAGYDVEFSSKTLDELRHVINSMLREDQTKVIPELKDTDLCFIEIDDAPDNYVTDSSGKVLDVSSDEFLGTFYDPYVGIHDNGYIVTKQSLGKDESGLYDIYEYDFKPANWSRTILITSGMHTYELSAHFGAAWLINKIMEDHDTNPMLGYLYENVRIKIIPIINPWGWNQPVKTYGNCNGVNINRNFDSVDENGNSVWESFPVYTPEQNEWNVKGEYPFSEAETRILRDWALYNADSAEFWIDCHTGLGNGPWDNFIYYMSDAYKVDRVQNALDRLTQRIYDVYGTTSVNEVRVDYYTSIRHAWARDVAKIATMTVEQTPSNLKWGTALNNEAGDIANFTTTLGAYIMEYLVTDYVGNTGPEITPVGAGGKVETEIGGIASVNGKNTSVENRIRSVGYIPVTELTFSVSYNTELFSSYLVRAYDKNKNYLRSYPDSAWSTADTVTVDSDVAYIRVLLRPQNDTPLSADDLNNVNLKITDKTPAQDLTISHNAITVKDGQLTGEVKESRIVSDFVAVSPDGSVEFDLTVCGDLFITILKYDEDKNYLGYISDNKSASSFTLTDLDCAYVKFNMMLRSDLNAALPLDDYIGELIFVDGIKYRLVNEET